MEEEEDREAARMVVNPLRRSREPRVTKPKGWKAEKARGPKGVLPPKGKKEGWMMICAVLMKRSQSRVSSKRARASSPRARVSTTRA